MSYPGDLSKIYEMPISIIYALKSVFDKIDPIQLIFQLCSKININNPTYSFEEDLQYKYKCIGKLQDSISVVGYNNVKKQAKKITSELLIIEMIKRKAFRKKTIRVLIRDYKVNQNLFQTNNQNSIKNTSNEKNLIDADNCTKQIQKKEELQLKSNHFLENKTERSIDKTPILPLITLKNSAYIETHMALIPKENKIELGDEVIKPQFNEVISDKEHIKRFLTMTEKLEYIWQKEFKSNEVQSSLLNFELFCLKWERILIIDRDTMMSISKFIQNLSLMIVKSKTKRNFKHSLVYGSYYSSSMRLNYIVIDYFIVLNQDNLISENNNHNHLKVFQDFIEYSDSDLIKHNYQFDLKKQNDASFLEVSTKNDLKCKIQFISDNQSKIIKEHMEYISQKQFTIEQEVALKIVKAWRRSKSLLFLNPIIIEFIIAQIDNSIVNQVIISFFIIMSNLEEEMFDCKYQRELIANFKLNTKYLNNILVEVKYALEAIKKNKFNELF